MSASKAKRKLRKLLNDPRKFVEDSPVGKAANIALGRHNDQSLLGYDLGELPSDTTNRATRLSTLDIMTAVAAQVPVFFVDDESTDYPAICTLERNWLQLLETLLDVCRDHSLLLAICEEAQHVVPRSARSALQLLGSTASGLVRLSDKRSLDQFYFYLESWKEHGDHIMSPRPNMTSRKVWKRCLEEAGIPAQGRVSYLADILTCQTEHAVPFDIDFVYTWVNNDDPHWQKLYAAHTPNSTSDSTSLARFYNRNELMYSLRSLTMYAPWIRTVHIVSNCAPPAWLDVEHERINWVQHDEIFESKHLPTFSSHAIESRLHHIKGLANYFVYSNDDFLLTRPAKKSDFFEPNGLCKLKLEEWGNVNGKPTDGEPDYLNGARTSQALLERDFSVSPTQLHCHAPQALRVDILTEMEKRYAAEFEITAASRFRSVTDVAVTGFFFHHYAYVTGRAIKDNVTTTLIQQNHNFGRKFKGILQERDNPNLTERSLSICINDGQDSHLNTRWNTSTERFLQTYFFRKSEFER